MCKGGGGEEGSQRDFGQSMIKKEVDSADGTEGPVSCELCSSEASLYCQADDAFLCRKCDRWVHGANFLAQRHIRCLLCTTCHSLTRRYLIGASLEVVLPTILSLTQRSQCNSDGKTMCPRTLKMPFLFL
ncbi:B-box domain protein 30 [Cornus florida]|uniref:B-box domain protein 30 n=1 Tax=Cornus florida TaxID=4283 RepID=UPI00289A28B1|nr:B-box domain protein 30 [Cornus florida]